MSSDRLEGLLEKLSRGDPAAVEQLVRAWEPSLLRLIRRKLSGGWSPALDASDVLQGAWSDVLEGLRTAQWSFADLAHFRAFLCRVIRNRCIDCLRHFRRTVGRERRLADLGPDELPASPLPGPAEIAQARELWNGLHTLCPEEHWDILRLRRLGFSRKEIAARTGLHEGSVRRLLRGLARRLPELAGRAVPPPQALHLDCIPFFAPARDRPVRFTW